MFRGKLKAMSRIGAVMAPLFLIQSAFAVETTKVNLVSAGSNVVDNVYIGPYYAKLGDSQSAVAVICDNYDADSYVNETWDAYVSYSPDLTNAKFGSVPNAPALYQEAAWLSLALMNASAPAVQADIQYAIWGLFSSNPILTTRPGSAGWLAQASTATNIPDFVLYTPVDNTAMLYGQSMPSPQELIVVKTPEASSWAVLAIDLAGLASVLMIWKRRQGALQV